MWEGDTRVAWNGSELERCLWGSCEWRLDHGDVSGDDAAAADVAGGGMRGKQQWAEWAAGRAAGSTADIPTGRAREGERWVIGLGRQAEAKARVGQEQQTRTGIMTRTHRNCTYTTVLPTERPARFRKKKGSYSIIIRLAGSRVRCK